LVSPAIFEKAQERFASQTALKTNEQLIQELRTLLQAKGKLSERIVLRESSLPSQGAYQRRFGSQSEAFLLAGYNNARIAATQARRRRRVLRDQLVRELIRQCPKKMTIVQRNGHRRVRIRMSRALISVYVVPRLNTAKGEIRWVLNPIPAESMNVSLIARLNEKEDGFEDYFLVPNLRRWTRLTLTFDDPRLKKGKSLIDFADFPKIVNEVRLVAACRW
jgi:hypothetical protein